MPMKRFPPLRPAGDGKIWLLPPRKGIGRKTLENYLIVHMPDFGALSREGKDEVLSDLLKGGSWLNVRFPDGE